MREGLTSGARLTALFLLALTCLKALSPDGAFLFSSAAVSHPGCTRSAHFENLASPAPAGLFVKMSLA